MASRERTGYALFGLSGVVFVIIGIRERDVLTLLAAALWLAGCAMFMIGAPDE